MRRLDQVLEPVNRPVSVERDKTYPLLGVRWYGKGCHVHSTLSGDELKTKILHQVSPLDVVYNKMWTKKGAFAIVDDGAAHAFATAEYPAFVVHREKVDAWFLRYALNTTSFVEQASAACRGTTSRARLNPKDFLSLEIPCPPLGEQRKIAAILASVDETIGKTESVIAQLQVVKKAVMQELLTRGLPGRHTRFKHTELGEVPQSWDVVLLDHVARRGSGHTPDKKHPEYWDGGIKWVSLKDSQRLDRLYINDTTAKISALGIENSSAVEHPAGTVVLSRDAGVGKSAITTDVMAVSQHFMAWVCSARLDNHYLYYLLQRMKPEFERIAIGNTIKTIGLPYFKALRIPLPPVDEQRRIAESMVAIDKRMFAEEESVQQLIEVKQALMSALLTGQVRVTPDGDTP